MLKTEFADLRVDERNMRAATSGREITIPTETTSTGTNRRSIQPSPVSAWYRCQKHPYSRWGL